jgi:hypothetical protein
MGIFRWLLGIDDEEQDLSRDRGGPPPIPSRAGAGPDLDSGPHTTKTERDLRHVEGQYDAKSYIFDPKQ